MTPEEVLAYQKQIEELRGNLLFGSDNNMYMTPEAEQYFLLSLSSLEAADRFMKLAHFKTMQGK